MSDWPLRTAAADELTALAKLWQTGWTEAHAAHVPAELTRKRTFDDFLTRLHDFGDALRIAGPQGAPLGLCIVRDDEMHQLYVSPAARGTGLAGRLLADAEARLAAAGVTDAWLDVIEENVRARRFYERQGWCDRGIKSVELATTSGPVAIRALVMVKRLA